MTEPRFNYDSIPVGYYDALLQEGRAVRRLWHLSKFERVIDCLPKAGTSGEGQSILDIGCFAGSFLGMLPKERFRRQVGVDILPEQVAYANAHYGTDFRRFVHIAKVDEIASLEGPFDCVTLIEVIEHLNRLEIAALLAQVAAKLRAGGMLVLTTPNYASAWPVLEFILNRVSEVSYEEQHITKFTYYGIERTISRIYPAFAEEFIVEAKTTTHFVTPFLAEISFRGARALSRAVPHRRWHLPLGSLALLVLRRR